MTMWILWVGKFIWNSWKPYRKLNSWGTQKKINKNDEEEEGEEDKNKIITHKAIAKRFRISGSGKILRTKGCQGHFRRRKSKRAKRQFVEMQEVKGSRYSWRINNLAPYLKR